MKKNKLYKLASGHLLLIPEDAPIEIVPMDMNAEGSEPSRYAAHLRDVARNIDAADERLSRRR